MRRRDRWYVNDSVPQEAWDQLAILKRKDRQAMTTDRIQQAIAKAYEDVSQFNEKYFPNVTAERKAALAVIEAAHNSLYASLSINTHDALNAWADIVLGDKP